MSSRALNRGVAILTTFYRPVVGGAETAAAQLADYLAGRGHDVLVVTTRTQRSHLAQERQGSVRIYRGPWLGERRAWTKWLALPGLSWRLWRLRKQYGLIYVVDFRAIGLSARLVGWLTRRPVVFQAETDGAFAVGAIRALAHRVTGHEDGWLARALTWPIRRAYRGAALNFCISHAIVDEAIQGGWPADKVVYLPHTVDRTLFKPAASLDERRALRRSLGMPTDAIVVIFVGRLSREKGLLDLAVAWRQMPKRDALLVCVGPDMTGHPWNAGPTARALLQEAALPSLFPGSTTPEIVARYLQAADLAVLPSHFEAFGIAAAEAMACGLPVVVTDVKGFHDYVVHERNGLVAPVGAPDALRDAMQRLIDEPETRAAYGAAARTDIAVFDREVVMARCESCLDQLTAVLP